MSVLNVTAITDEGVLDEVEEQIVTHITTQKLLHNVEALHVRLNEASYVRYLEALGERPAFKRSQKSLLYAMNARDSLDRIKYRRDELANQVAAKLTGEPL